jgi:WD40 repeat protein/ribosomal protein S27E
MAESSPDMNDAATQAKARLDATCPSCSRRLKVPVSKVGRKIHCPVCNGRFLVRPVGGPAEAAVTRGEFPGPAQSPGRAAGGARQDRPGDLFANRFRIVGKLGSGTFGAVYHAFDTKDYCDVALKVPDENILFNSHFMVRFRAEAEILERMRHPNIVTYYDAQLDRSPRFLVSEFIAGCDLERELAQLRKAGRWIDRDQAIWIVEKLARALHHAHRKNVIHRDVKPANILIKGDVVKLTDFGLARFGDPNMTQAGAKIGTPFYMSPEQVTGDPSCTDARSDQYGLAVVLFELLCGRRPFEGRTSEAVFVKLLNEPTPRLTSIDPSIPAELAKICEKALSRDPAGRWPDCDAFATALRPWAPARCREAPARIAGAAGDNAAVTATEPDEFAVTGGVIGGPESTLDDPLARRPGPVAGRLSAAVEKGKSRLAPLASAVEPLGKSLATTVRISSRAIGSRWPRWMESFIGVLTGWVDLLNEKLSRIESAEQPATRRPDEDVFSNDALQSDEDFGPSDSGQSDEDESFLTDSDDSIDLETARAVSSAAASLGMSAKRGSSSGPIPLESLGEGRPPLRGSGVVLANSRPAASRAASHSGEARRQSYIDSIKAAHQAWCEHRRGDAIDRLDRCALDRRNWEWAYLQALCRSPITTYRNHAGELGALAFDGSGRVLAATDEKGVAVWDTTTHRLLGRYCASLKRVDTVAISADGRWLAASVGKTIRIYDLKSPAREEPVHVLHGHEALVNRVVFAADGNHLVSASLDQSIRVWSVRDGALLVSLRGDAGPVHTLAFHPHDGGLLVASHGSGTLIVWNWVEACELRRGTMAETAIDTLAISPDGRLVVAGARDGTVAFAEFSSLARSASSQAHAGPVRALAIDPSGRWLVSLGAGKERSIRVGAADSSLPPAELGRLVLNLPFAATSLTTLAFSPGGGGRMALAGGRDGTVKLWDAASFWALLAAGTDGERARAVAIHPSGSYRAVARLDGAIEVKNLGLAAQPRIFAGKGSAACALAFQPRQLYLVSGGEEGSVTFWDIVSGEPVHQLDAHAGAVLGLAFDPEGRLMATAGADGIVRIWDAEHRTMLHALHGHDGKAATAVAFAAFRGMPRLYSAGADRLVHVWDPRTGERLASLDRHQHRVVSLAASPDGGQVVSVGEDRALFVWSTGGEEPLLALNDIDVLAGLAWHQPASVLAAVCEDRSVIVETLPRHHQNQESRSHGPGDAKHDQ